MPKIESEKIDCLHRPCSQPAPRFARTQKSWNNLIAFRRLHSCFLLELALLVLKDFHLPIDTPKSRETREDGRFSTALTGMKNCTIDSGCTPAPRDATKLSVFFRFFESFLWHFNKNSVQRWSSDFQGLFRVKIRKMALGSNDLSTFPSEGSVDRSRHDWHFCSLLPDVLLSWLYLFIYLLIFEGFPNRVLVYPDRGGLQIMLMICTNKLCQCWWMWVSAKEKRDVESAKGKGAWELLLKGLTPKLWRDREIDS